LGAFAPVIGPNGTNMPQDGICISATPKQVRQLYGYPLKSEAAKAARHIMLNATYQSSLGLLGQRLDLIHRLGKALVD
jgi:hypothetical protein